MIIFHTHSQIGIVNEGNYVTSLWRICLSGCPGTHHNEFSDADSVVFVPVYGDCIRDTHEFG